MLIRKGSRSDEIRKMPLMRIEHNGIRGGDLFADSIDGAGFVLATQRHIDTLLSKSLAFTFKTIYRENVETNIVRISSAMGVSVRSNRDDDLADLPARFEITVRFDNLVECKYLIDDWL